MSDIVSAWSDFFSQPFGVVGAACIMAAVTVINSQWLSSRLAERKVATGFLFNGLNLVGGICLFVNAILRNEVVWLVLETYFVMVALKGLTQSRRKPEQGSGSVATDNALVTEPQASPAR